VEVECISLGGGKLFGTVLYKIGAGGKLRGTGMYSFDGGQIVWNWTVKFLGCKLCGTVLHMFGCKLWGPGLCRFWGGN
jgi:hypothetical protein